MARTREVRRKRLLEEWKDLPEDFARPPRKRRGEEEAEQAAKKARASLNDPPSEVLEVYLCGHGLSGELGSGKADEIQLPERLPQLRGLEIIQIAVGAYHCIALTQDQRILTWGENKHRTLGRLTLGMNNHFTPTAIDTGFLDGRKATQVVATNAANFVLTEDGDVYGWGTFIGGEGDPLKDPPIGFTSYNATLGYQMQEHHGEQTKLLIQGEPILIEGLSNIKTLSAGDNHVLALDNKGKVFSWGVWEKGQLGRRYATRDPYSIDTEMFQSFTPAPILYDIGYISAGPNHSFAISATSSIVFAWGLNDYFQTNISFRRRRQFNLSDYISVPTRVTALSGHVITHIAAGAHHSIACTAEGLVYTWGRCDKAQCGVDISEIVIDRANLRYGGESASAPVIKAPQQVLGTRATFVAAGADHCTILTPDGEARAWGLAPNLQNGLGSVAPVDNPTRVPHVVDTLLTFAAYGKRIGVLAGVSRA